MWARCLQEVNELNQAMDGHEGCNIYGWLDLQRMAGNFRVSVHVGDFFMLTKVCMVANYQTPEMLSSTLYNGHSADLWQRRLSLQGVVRILI